MLVMEESSEYGAIVGSQGRVIAKPSPREVNYVFAMFMNSLMNMGIGRNKFSVDVEEILKIKPSRRVSEHVLAWQLEKSSIFAVRSAYKLPLNELPELWCFGASSIRPSGDDTCWTKIWHVDVDPP
jgi:hypothetical protein